MNAICVFGDSIAYGLSDFESGGWCEMLRLYVLKNQERDLYNLGVDGDTVSGVINRIETETKIREASEIILAIGINDTQFKINFLPDMPIDQFSELIEQLIQKATQLVSKITYVGLTRVEDTKVQPFPWSTTGKCYGNKIIQKYDSEITRVCTRFSVPYIEVFDMLKVEDLADGLHPNTVGHKKLFKKILRKLNWQ